MMTLGAATIIQALRLGFGRSAAKASMTNTNQVTPLAKNTSIAKAFSMSYMLIGIKSSGPMNYIPSVEPYHP